MAGGNAAKNNPLPGWVPGLASLSAACAVAACIVLGVTWVFSAAPWASALAGLPPVAIEAAFTLVTFGLLALAALLAIRWLHVPMAPGVRRLAALHLGVGLGLGIAGCAVSVALCVIAGTVHVAPSAPGGLGLILLETLLVLLQSGAEELYFRGWLQGDLTRRWGAMPALVVTALAFALLHFLAGASEAFSFVTLFSGGLLFGLCYQRSGRLALPWALHFGWNWAEELLFGLDPNPGVGPFGALLNLDLSGPALWGGGREGLNASLSSFIALAALLCAVWLWPRGGGRGAGRPGLR